MQGKTAKNRMNHRTQEFLLEKCGVAVSEAEAEEIRRSLVQYCRLLIEISQDQPEEEEHARFPQSR